MRLAVEDHQTLIEFAGGMALSTYIHAKALVDALSRRRTRSTASNADKEALGQILGLLGQSRIANNLKQLAYHSNIGMLEMDEEASRQIAEAYKHVLLLRSIIMKALDQTARS
ncbi:hypothetical protein [Yoonia sp. R2-816]|uniref:hypothetical protein n=1 Tax=Yoonia sp. R2-816 TaxID=3342638 RepID=UPI00372D7416